MPIAPSAMKLQYASDLHIEFQENKNYINKNPLAPEGDILILAGDIVPISLIEAHSDFFNYLSDNFNITYWVPGNHEFYHFDINEKSLHINEKVRDNINLVNNICVSKGKVKFIFSTLWTSINPLHGFEIQMRYSDFRAIRNRGRLFSIDDYNSVHKKCLTFIKEELNKEPNGKTIVVTHHMPTFFNYPEIYKGDILSEAFAVELSDLIKATKPDYWIFGHHHTNKGDFKIGETKMLTNQLGYVMYFEHGGFNIKKTIQVE